MKRNPQYKKKKQKRFHILCKKIHRSKREEINVTNYAWLWIHSMFLLHETGTSDILQDTKTRSWPWNWLGYNFSCIYHVVTSARPCNNVGHLFWFTFLAQNETDDVIMYIHSAHKYRGNSFKLQDYKMRLKQIRLNWMNSMQVKQDPFH